MGASNWRVHMSNVPEHQEEDMGWGWLEGNHEQLKKCKEVMADIMEKRRELFTEPYCRKFIFCFFVVCYLLKVPILGDRVSSRLFGVFY